MQSPTVTESPPDSMMQPPPVTQQPSTDSMMQSPTEPQPDSMMQPPTVTESPPEPPEMQPPSETTTQDIPYKESTETVSQYPNASKKESFESSSSIEPRPPIVQQMPQRPQIPQIPQTNTMNKNKSPPSDQISIGQNGKEFDLNAYKEKQMKNQNKPNPEITSTPAPLPKL
jgi:hypothetical protein